METAIVIGGTSVPARGPGRKGVGNRSDFACPSTAPFALAPELDLGHLSAQPPASCFEFAQELIRLHPLHVAIHEQDVQPVAAECRILVGYDIARVHRRVLAGNVYVAGSVKIPRFPF